MKYKQTLFWSSIAILSAIGLGCSDDSGNSTSSSDSCALCKSDQVCENGSCVDKPSEGSGNQPGGSEPGGSEPGGNEPGGTEPGGTEPGGDQPSIGDGCSPACTGIESCVEGKCEPCATACGNVCCENGQLCDPVYEGCSDACADGSPKCADECCGAGYSCHSEYGCVKDCSDTQTACESYYMSTVLCCDEGYVCENGDCVLTCSPEVEKCGNICCDADQECHNGACRDKCDGIRCGEDDALCCDLSSEVCLFAQCITKGKSCNSSNDCAFDEYCEETTHMCVSVDADPNACVVLPQTGTFEPRLQWSWPKDLPGGKPSVYPDYDEVLDTPIAINLTDDNGDGFVNADDVPDVVFASRNIKLGDGSYYTVPGVLRVISGDDGREIASSPAIYYPAENVSAGDIDGDGQVEIVATRIAQSPNTVDILNVVPDENSQTGYSLKVKASVPTSYGIDAIGGQTDTSIADLDGDGIAEIITHRGIIEYDGTNLKWRCQGNLGYRPLPVNLDEDGPMEIVGYGIYDNNCNPLIAGTGKSREYWAVADLLPDSENAAEKGELAPEVVRTYYTTQAPGKFEVWKLYKKDGVWSKSVERTADIPINYERAQKELNLNCNTNKTTYNCLAGGGAPVIADFDGDKRPDIGFASRWYYIVYSNTDNGMEILWADANIRDYTSAATGSSVFDFEGDGIAEVVYGDEQTLHVYSGKGSGKDEDGDNYNDAVHVFSTPNTNGTLTEYPIIVDVDNDGSTEIVIASTRYKSDEIYGVRAFEDPNGQWVRTRRIWNQHNYYVTNINEDGTVPANPEANWRNPRLNNFHQNVQPSGAFNAPNLAAVSLTADTSNSCGFVCSSTMTDNNLISLTASIENKGSLGVKAGVDVTFYVVQDGVTARIGHTKVDTVIAPGAPATASYKWVGGHAKRVDNAQDIIIEFSKDMSIYYIIDEPTEGKNRGEFVECIETDNTSNAISVKCNVPLC